VTVGAAGVAFETVIVTDLASLPPVPVHVTVYVVFAVGVTTRVPEVGLPVPVEKLVPVHEVAFDDDQVRVALSPWVMLVSSAEKVTVGSGGTVTESGEPYVLQEV